MRETWTLSALLAFLVSLKLVPEVRAIDCYVCDSSKEIGCSEFITDSSLLQVQSCDNVYDAKYCVKMTQVFEGNLGTKRFCSSRDLGNFCEWVKRPGDEHLYQACVHTCSFNACNFSSAGPRSAALLVAMATWLGLVAWLAR